MEFSGLAPKNYHCLSSSFRWHFVNTMDFPPLHVESAIPFLWKVVNERCPNLLLKLSFHPWRENEAQERYVKEIDASVMKTWGIFFCGGSEGLISDLRALSVDYNIDLHIDSFAW